jgi:hypothetical protein
LKWEEKSRNGGKNNFGKKKGRKKKQKLKPVFVEQMI